MAWTVVRDGGVLQLSERTASVSALRIIANGFLLNILNPKLSLFFSRFLPQFVPADTLNPASTMLGLAATFMLLTFVVFSSGYGAFASATRRYVISRPRVLLWLRRGFAGAFGALGLRLAFADADRDVA
jgi:threonine/homoserine/homoserine lactone efflux protein